MNAIVDGYSAGADDYAKYWGPVLEETSGRLLDEVASLVSAEEIRLLDVGAGIGSLAREQPAKVRRIRMSSGMRLREV